MSQIPFLSPNQRCQSIQGNSNHRRNFLACCKMVKQNNCHSRWLYDVHIDAKSASLQPSSIEVNVLYSYAGRSQAWTKPINQQMDELTKHTSVKWMVNDWLSCGFTPHSTQNRSFQRRVPQQNSWLSMKKTKPNTKSTHSPIKRNVLQHKINTKTKASFSRLVRHPAWKWSGSILKRKGK